MLQDCVRAGHVWERLDSPKKNFAAGNYLGTALSVIAKFRTRASSWRQVRAAKHGGNKSPTLHNFDHPPGAQQRAKRCGPKTRRDTECRSRAMLNGRCRYARRYVTWRSQRKPQCVEARSLFCRVARGAKAGSAISLGRERLHGPLLSDRASRSLPLLAPRKPSHHTEAGCKEWEGSGKRCGGDGNRVARINEQVDSISPRTGGVAVGA